MYQGYYINLDRNAARLAALSQHLEERGASARYQRMPAVDGRAVAQDYQTGLDPGNIGCWLSHRKILEAQRGSTAHVHIIEDDTIFARNALATFDTLLQFADETVGHWDLIFTDVYISPVDGMACKDILRIIRQCQHTDRVGLLSLLNITFAGTSSYFVNGRSIGKYLQLLSVPPSDAIDMYLRSQVNQGALTAYVTVPFLTSISDESSASDISAGHQSRAVFDTLRRAFFQDADLASLDVKMEQFLEGAAPSTLESVYLKALRFVLSDKYVHF